MEYCILLQPLGRPVENNKLQCKINALVSPKNKRKHWVPPVYCAMLIKQGNKQFTQPRWAILKYLHFNRDLVPHLHLMGCLSQLRSLQVFHHFSFNKTQLAQPIKQYQSVTGELKVGTTAKHPLPKLFFLITLQRNYSENCSTSLLQPAVLTYPLLKPTQIRSELVLGSPSPLQLTPTPAILCRIRG